MRIGIVTQPLAANYGGFLQNYALQEVLRRKGHVPVTIDVGNKISLGRFILSTIRSLLFLFIPNKRRPFAKFNETRYNIRKVEFEKFIHQYISKTKDISRYNHSLIRKYNFDAIIVGSDQVWRPLYNKSIEDMYLRFVKQANIKKVAYAASFGTDRWEYSIAQTLKCKQYAKQLDAVSVREESGKKLCRTYLGVDASVVLDPTLLLSSKDYEYLCEQIPRRVDSPFIAAYILDRNKIIDDTLEEISSSSGMKVRIFEADAKSELSVEEWIAVYRDASYVITDSFHGTVFSIIFNKPFVCLGNTNRGNTRFDSLLGILDLQNRYLTEYANAMNLLSQPIVWSQVNAILEIKRDESLRFLLQALNS